MQHRYTVVWDSSAKQRLAELWLDNPAIRKEIAEAVDEIDAVLAQAPESVGIPAATGRQGRIIVRPPVSLLYFVKEEDCQVRVVEVKFWDE
jgi:hypothetical protein